MKVELLEYIDFYNFDVGHNDEVRPIIHVFEINDKVVRILVSEEGEAYPEDYHRIQAVWGFDKDNVHYKATLIETVDPAIVIGADFEHMGTKEKYELADSTRRILKEHGF
jgi:hypothetical protein